MEIKILGVGTLKEKYLQQMQADYMKRLANYTKINIIEVMEERGTKSNDSKIKIICDKEGKRLIEKIPPDSYVILLDLAGEMIDSLSFSQMIQDRMTYGPSKLIFVIGGSYGVSSELKKRADFRLSFSPLTFTHQIIRILLLEQIYRGFKIINHETYHK